MDFFLANTITISFFVLAYFLVKKQRLIRKRSSFISAFFVAVGLIVGLLLVSFCFALILDAVLPDIYVYTFAYKTVFVSIVFAIHWFWQAVKQQSGSQYA